MEFDKILELSDDKTVKLTEDFKDLLGKELQLGMSNYVIKNGNLSEGFEKLLPHQHYYQSLREMWTLGNSVRETKSRAMIEQSKFKWYSLLNTLFGYVPILNLWIKAKLMYSKHALTNLLVTIEDQVRQIKAFNEVRQELLPQVRAKYKSIEDSEPDTWEAVLKYRMARNKFGHKEFINHVPGTPERKAAIGVYFDCPESAVWLAVQKEKEINEKHGGNVLDYLAANNYLPSERSVKNILPLKKKD